MSGSATSSGQFFIGVAPGAFSLQNFSELSYVELETATISTSGCFFRPGKWRGRTILPAPTTPPRRFSLFLCIGFGASAILQTLVAVMRAKFDRIRDVRVQLKAAMELIRLTRAPEHGSLASFLRRNESLQHHRIKSSTRQRHSPARSGQEKRRRRPAHHKNGAARFRAQLASPADLGAGAKEVCAHPRHRARS